VRVTLLHGFAGDPSAWDGVIGAWASRTTVPDPIALPGHGGGDVLAGWHANLDQIAVSLGSVDAVVGYSFGARVALGLLAARKCSRAVLIGCNPGIDDRDGRKRDDARWADLLRTRGIAAFVDAWEAQPLFATQVRAPAVVREARRARRLALDPEQLARCLEEMGLAAMPDYRGALAAFADRITLVVGADDGKFIGIANALGQPYVAIPDSGHDPTLEQPARLARVIARALD